MTTSLALQAEHSPRYCFMPALHALAQSYISLPGIWIWYLATGRLMRKIDEARPVLIRCSPAKPVLASVERLAEGLSEQAVFIDAQLGESWGGPPCAPRT